MITIDNTLIELHGGEDGAPYELYVAGSPFDGMTWLSGELDQAMAWINQWVTSGAYARRLYWVTGHGAQQSLDVLRRNLAGYETSQRDAQEAAEAAIAAMGGEWTPETIAAGREALSRLEEATNDYESVTRRV